MAKAKYVNTSRMNESMDINMQQNVDITESVMRENELIDPDLLLRSFGISDDFVDHMADLYNPSESNKAQSGPGVIMKNSQREVVGDQTSSFSSSANSQGSQNTFQLTNLQNIISTPQSFPFTSQPVTTSMMSNPFASTSSSSSLFLDTSAVPVTLQQRSNNQQQQQQQQQQNSNVPSSSSSECHVTLPLETLQNLLSQQTLLSHQNISFSSTDTGALVALGQYQQSEGLGAMRKRSHETFTQEGQQQQQQQQAADQKFGDIYSQIFSVPSPVALSPIYVEQKPLSMNGSDDISTFSKISPRTTPRPSPASTPPPMQIESQREREYKKRNDSGRCTPIGKRSRPQSPTSDCDSDGSYREREPLAWASTGRMTPTETKPAMRLEDMVDEDKYNKRKRSTSGGHPVDKEGRKKDPLKAMLEQLQSHIPHIGNPDEEKVSHAGLLVEGSDYIRSLMRENNTTRENVEALKMKIEQLNAEIEDFQQKLPEHGSSSIHRIVSSRGKSIPDMFADHVRQRTQSDWRYWVFTSIMGHFVHSFAQDVSNISPQEMQSTSLDWLGERMSLQQLRKDAFRKLAKLCSKTSIMEDPSKLPEEARSFVALNDPDPPESKAERESYGRKF